MSCRKIGLALAFILMVFYAVNTQAQEEAVFTLTDQLTVENGVFRVGAPHRVFSIGCEGVYLYIELKDVRQAILLDIKMLNPLGEEVLSYRINISSPREKNILRYPWVKGYLYIPVRDEKQGFAFFRVYYYEKVAENLPENVRINMGGEWTFRIYRNGELIKTLKFTIRLLKLKVYVLDSQNRTVDKAKARILGPHKTFIVDINNGLFELELYPGSYLVEIYKANVLVYKSTLNLTTKDIEVRALCNITDLTFRILDRSGKPLREAKVVLKGLDNILQTSTDSDGFAVFRNLPYRQYRISVVKYGVSLGEYNIEVSAPLTIHDLVVNVTDFCVKVVGENGKGLAKSEVTLFFPSAILTALTDEEGYAKFDQVPVGVWDIAVSYKNLREKGKVTIGDGGCAEVKLRVFLEVFGMALSYDITLTVAWGLITVAVLAVAALALRGRIAE